MIQPASASFGSSPEPYSLSLRGWVYIAANIGVLLLMGAGAAVHPSGNPRFLYVLLLTAICTSPILQLSRINGAYFLLTVYFAFFFQFFALGDLMRTLVGRSMGGEDAILSESEMVILVSAVGVVAGYHAAVRWFAPRADASAPRDWPFAAVISVGLALWIIGTLSLGYWQTVVITDRTNASLLKNLNELGAGLTSVFMIGQLIQPLGILILAYAYAAYRSRYLLALILIVVIVQVILGFVADFKSEAMSAALLVIITKVYVNGKIPKGWLVGAALFIALAFPVFQAYRLQVRGEHGVTSVDAIQNLLGTLESALAAKEKVDAGFGGAEYKVQSFWERASLKASVELIVTRTGTDSPFQEGATLAPLVTAFIPKLVWSDKPSLAVGQMFNKEFHISEVEDTYISPSHVGEIFWNFGWFGTLALMPATGLLLGAIGVRCRAFPGLSLTRMMVMFVTIVAFAVRMEGSIATEYVVWVRSVAAIAILHWLFARSAHSQGADSQIQRPPEAPLQPPQRFPQLLN